MHPSEFLTLRRSKSSKPAKARLAVETLEMRVIPYATTGNAWPHPNLVTISFVPDGTNLGGVSSSLFATFNAKWSTTVWENQILRAAQVWAQRSNLNFTVATDSGAATGSGSYEQGDPTIGDIRIGGYNFGSSTLATGFLPPPANNYSIAGDIEFNTGQVWAIGNTYDLFTVAAHEFGHALGMTHSTDATAVMYGTYNTRKTDLGSDDIAGIQSIYGARTPDQYDTGAGNNTFGTAADISSQINSTSLTALVTNLNIATTSDLDYFTFAAPAGTAGSFTVTVQSKGLSLLCPALAVYAADQSTVLGSVTGLNRTGNTLSLTISNVAAGQRFYVKVGGADTTAFGTGAYALTLNFGTGPSPTVLSPNTQTLATGTPTTGGGQANDTLLPNDVVTQTALGTVDTVSNLALVPGPGTAPVPVSDSGSTPGRNTRTGRGRDTLQPADTTPLGIAVTVIVPMGTASANDAARPSAVTVVTGSGLTGNTKVAAVSAPALPWSGAGIDTTQSGGSNIPDEAEPASLSPDGTDVSGTFTEKPENESLVPAAGAAAALPAELACDPWTVPSFLRWLHGDGTGITEDNANRDWAVIVADGSPWYLAAGVAAFLGLPGANSRWFVGQRKQQTRPIPIPSERRGATRYPCWLNSFCWPIGRPLIERCQSFAQDVSTTGVKLVLRRPFNEGTVLLLEMEGSGAGHQRRLVGRVVHVLEAAPGVWELGCVFHPAVDNDAVQELLLAGLYDRAASLLPEQ
jgi:hypothetical protein